MALDAKKHSTIAAGESPTRAALAEGIFSINDIIPVANATEAGQVASAVASAGQTLASDPVFVSRADARGLHRIEYSYNGTTWLPASGVLSFADKAAADTWASTNSAYLVAGDRCRVGTTEYVWSGAAWRRATYADSNRTAGGVLTVSTIADVATVTLPSDAPAGTYFVTFDAISDANSVNARYHRILWDAAELTSYANDYASNAPIGAFPHNGGLLKTGHTGGAATVKFQLQVNASGPIYRYARLTVVFIGP